ncbi:double-strand break repair protein MRE11 isoform X1 [Trichogramma pretiosum]|uniref:double-strand break repair protein MRE11 isoform X1 n=1 Tax=Trichogramma pretiosum TaxID=7493 RepID=UPI0006C9E34E|nr:double-strand break repair protein MRE11 isoform X1 [Trichogramma pretiosum]
MNKNKMGSSDEEESFSNENNSKNESPEKLNDESLDEKDVMKILVATDLHLGYEQTTKRVQEDDSFRTFEEILQYAEEHEVDMILLGGDLFHEAKPSHNVVTKCINLLRKYCLNERQVKIQFLTDPEVAFSHCEQKKVNYEDKNFKVGIPVFSIHGNHDDPSFGAVGTMDVLAATGLINYFGKWSDVTKISIVPLLFRKGSTTVALYGLSYMNDQRLSRLIRNDKFHFVRGEETGNPFNMLILHQNRAQHSKNSFVPEDLLPDFLDLVIYGHEHECLIMPERSKLNPKIHVCQPGSSVATSLAQGESVPKHVGLLSIYKNKFKMDQLPLKTVRPFVFEDLLLNECNDEISTFKSRTEAVEEFVDNYVENVLIPRATELLTDHPMQPQKPLIRLRIFYSNDNDMFDPLRLSQKYYHVVANPHDIFLFRKCSSKLKKKDIIPSNQDLGEIEEIFRFDEGDKDWKRSVQGGISDYFKQDDQVGKLTVLSLNELNRALSRFVDTNDGNAFNELVEHQVKETVSYLLEDGRDYKNKQDILEGIKDYSIARELSEEDNKEKNFNHNVKNVNSNDDALPDDTPAKKRGKYQKLDDEEADCLQNNTKRSKAKVSKKISALDISTSSGSKKI